MGKMKIRSTTILAVKKDGNTVEWYEVDTETWKISVY